MHTVATLRILLPSTMSSLSGYASLTQEHLPPHDTINAVVRTADGAHGLVELTFGAPVPSRTTLAHSDITVTGATGWLSLEKVASPATRGAMRLTVHTRVTDAQGRPTGEEETAEEFAVSGVSEEFRRFFAAVGGQDDGFGKPEDALKDVAFIQAALHSNGAPIDLIKLVQ